METITINGVIYEILTKQTPEEHEAAGRHNTAREMRKNAVALDIYMKRPKGNKLHSCVQFVDGRFSTVSNLGRWE